MQFQFYSLLYYKLGIRFLLLYIYKQQNCGNTEQMYKFSSIFVKFMNLPSLSRYSQMAQLHVYYEGPGRIVCKKNLNNCNLKWVCIPFGITHGQQVGSSTSFDLWSVPVISFSEGIFGSPQRDQGSHPTSDGALDAKVTCAIASYVCYSHEHTLLKYSFQVLP